MSVTTVDIDKELLAEAKSSLGAATTKATIDHALREAVMRRRQSAAIAGLAGLDLERGATKNSDGDRAR